jgi:signal transduction histidine kinase
MTDVAGFMLDSASTLALLDISLSALVLLRPLYGSDGNTVADFAMEYLNPAGQRMLGLPQRPEKSLFAAFPGTRDTNVSTFFCRVFETGAADRLEIHYQADGFDDYFFVVAQRHDDFLVVSFTDASEQPRTKVEQALRDAQAGERAALAEAEAQRQMLQNVLTQAPACIGFFQGEDFVVAMANKQLCTLWGRSLAQVLQKPLLEAVPELQGQGFEHLLAEVARTGMPYVGSETPAQLLHNGQLATHYFNFVYQPVYGSDGQVLGVLSLAVEVSEQVRSRQQVQQLNAELEARVAERTQTALDARKAAETERGRLERLLMALPAAICVLSGPKLVFELVNPTCQQLFPDWPLLGEELLAVAPQLTGTDLLLQVQRVMETGASHLDPNFKLQIRSKEGTLQDRYFNLLCKPLHDDPGHVDSLVVFAFETTRQIVAQQRAEALQRKMLTTAQQQAEERQAFYQVFEQTPAMIALLRGPEHHYEYYNPAYQRLFPNRQLRGLPVAEVRVGNKDQGFGALLDHVYQTGEIYYGHQVPVLIKQPDSQAETRRYFSFTYQPYKEVGETVGVSVFAYDVTEHVLAQQRREALERELRELFEQAPVSICLFGGPDFVYELASQQHQQLFPDRTLLGRPLLEAVPELTDQHVWRTLQRVYQTGETVVDMAVRVPLAPRQGEPLQDAYFDYIFQARHNAHGDIDGVLVFAFEVTQQVTGRQQVLQLNRELLSANQELASANQQLTRANTDLANFIYTASHDLKTPIANIEGLVELLHRLLPGATGRDEKISRVLTMMQGAVERFQLTIAQLTDISRLQQAHAQPTEEIDLAALVEQVRLDLAKLVASTNAHITVDVAACPTVSFAPKNLRSIVYNLLSNGIKYHAPNRTPLVQLRARQDAAAGTTILEVQDNGLGLRPDQQAKLFGMFQRLHDHVEGTGIGLYMVKKIVDNVGGAILVQSTIDIGTTFSIILPN